MKPRKVGRPQDPNKLIFRTVGMPAEFWAFVDLFQGPNVTQRCIDLVACTKRYVPLGPDAGRPRDAKGRFLSDRQLRLIKQQARINSSGDKKLE